MHGLWAILGWIAVGISAAIMARWFLPLTHTPADTAALSPEGKGSAGHSSILTGTQQQNVGNLKALHMQEPWEQCSAPVVFILTAVLTELAFKHRHIPAGLGGCTQNIPDYPWCAQRQDRSCACPELPNIPWYKCHYTGISQKGFFFPFLVLLK